MSAIKGFLEKLLFTLGVLIFMQVPQFVDHYTQRLGGYYQAQVAQMDKYQNIANRRYSGDLEVLISEFNSSQRASVRDTADIIQSGLEQVAALKSELDALENNLFANKIINIVSNLRFNIAEETARAFTPGLPLTIEAIMCGVCGGVLFNLMIFAFFRLPKLLFRKQEQKPGVVTRRIEPSVTRARVRTGNSVSRPM